MNPILRPIRKDDDPIIAEIIRNCLVEYKANKPGTVFFDESTDHLSELFEQPGSVYFIAEQEGKILGGSGIFPTTGLPEGTAELVKMYLHNSARAKGIGKLLMETCLTRAKAMGYRQVYLETMPELKDALKLYERSGFDYISSSLGQSGHTGCDLYMLKKL